MFHYLVSLLFAFVAVVLSVFWYPIYLLSGKRAGHLFLARFFFATLLKINKITVVLEGAEHIVPHRNYLIISNHQSVFDIPILSASLPLDIRIFAKKELMHIPLFGWMMWLYDFVFVDRRSKKGAVAALKRGVAVLERFSFLVFPEGTRSVDGTVAPFKTGAMEIARKSSKEVLPVAVKGSINIMKKNNLAVAGGTVFVHIFPPILIDESANRKETALRFQRMIADFVEQKQ